MATPIIQDVRKGDTKRVIREEQANRIRAHPESCGLRMPRWGSKKKSTDSNSTFAKKGLYRPLAIVLASLTTFQCQKQVNLLIC